MPAPRHDYIPLSNGHDGIPTEEPAGRHHRPSRTGLMERILRRRSSILGALLFVLLLAAFGRYRPSPQGTERSAWPADIHPQENEYFSTGKIWDHNDEISAKLERCASLGILRNTSLPLPAISDEEEATLIAQGCGTNETTVLILADEWFVGAYEARRTTGEVIYAQSVISTLNAYGYSYMFASLGWMNYDTARIMEIWQKHRWNVRLVLGERNHVKHCWENKGRKCLRTREFPGGIDPWRLMSFWYWDDPVNPLGHQWTLSASHLNQNFFLGYSIEPTCRRLPYVPQSQRSNPPQAYILSKRGNYLKSGPEFAWDLPYLASLQKSLGISVVAGFSEEDETSAVFAELGMKDVGKLGQIQFYEMLAMSFVMIGVGRPRISPSPWDALCMGTPFINPIVAWDESDPSNRSAWHAQQWRMIDLHPPYVYHVHAHDLPALQAAIAAARNTPIESFIPPHMRFDHVCERTAFMVERDWRGLALEVLEDRRSSGKGSLFDVF